jgi:hypothetical protein
LLNYWRLRSRISEAGEESQMKKKKDDLLERVYLCSAQTAEQIERSVKLIEEANAWSKSWKRRNG